MKKTLAAILALVLCLSAAMAPVAAAESTNIYVTISNAGTLEAVRESVSVTDTDGDGALTINDALYCAHEKLYEGGAEAGYTAAETEYGLSMTKLWGVDNGGSYGYYLNNASAWSLADEVKSGDHVYAFSYSDLTAWSDAYSFFDRQTAEVAVGGKLELTLSSAGYDAEWNPVTLPCEGAVVTAGGAEYTTDAKGAVSVSFEKAGTYIVTASSESVTLVPPVCVVTVRTFADTIGRWCADEIESVIAQGLFSGSDKGFEPKAAMSRAMLVTVLYRMEGSPAVTGENTFSDVKTGAYYENAVIWAAANGIVTGNDDGTFAPNSDVTREQMAAFLWRYAKYKGYDVSVGEDTNILSYTDAAAVHEYAVEAMQWACGAGVITGKTTDSLDPTGSALREQVAVILDRFVSSVK